MPAFWHCSADILSSVHCVSLKGDVGWTVEVRKVHCAFGEFFDFLLLTSVLFVYRWQCWMCVLLFSVVFSVV